MNSVKRPGQGRPNRRGGGGGRGRGRGGGGGRGGATTTTTNKSAAASFSSSRKSDLLDDDDMVDYANDYEEFSEEEEEDVEMEEQYDYQTGKTETVVKKQEKRKIQMQVLHMSDESQHRIERALKEIHGENYTLRDLKSYKNRGNNLNRRFWVADRQLLVRGMGNINASQKSEHDLDLGDVSKFAMDNLLRFGFHPKRCLTSLQETDGNVGKALENLMASAFDVKVKNNTSVDVEMMKELREDEKMALESIYGDFFQEKLVDKVWEIRLKLPAVFDSIPKEKAKAANVKPNDLPKDACRFYLNGFCKFGARCRMRHVQVDKVRNVDDRHLRNDDEKDAISYLEIRFLENSHYPHNPPLVGFRTDVKQFPASACLNITKKLQEEAKNLALDHSPSVFTLVNLLEQKETVKEGVNAKQSEFGFDPDLVPNRVLQSSSSSSSLSGAEALMTGLGLKEFGEVDETKARQKEVERKKKRDLERMLNDNQSIRKRFKQKQVDDRVMKVRKSLPAWNNREKIVNTIAENQVVVISGMTGCGKSTQVPQYIMDHWLSTGNSQQHCNLICTQPRRISAIGVGERVAFERNEKIGNLVGYQIRLESKTSQWTRLLFCTTGILLRRLESDPDLDQVTHVIVDEVHERSEESDFLLMILRGALRRRKDLKVILMSATINADLFSNYFGKVPILEIPGKTFPVEQIFLEDTLHLNEYAIEEGSGYARHQNDFRNPAGVAKENFKGGRKGDTYIDDFEIAKELNNDNFKPPRDNQRDEQISPKQIHHRYNYCDDSVCRTLSLMDFNKIDYDLIESTLHFIAEGDHDYPRSGSILVFLPGMQEIMTLHDQLAYHPLFGIKAGRFKLVPLHSSLSSEEQAAVFEKPKNGARKIVISTNLAETSITIEDCVFVVDVGRMKEKHFDSTKNMESLDTVWVSRANGLQRKGRAGRVMPGVCFHLYTKFRFDHHLSSDPLPEIKRVPLEQLILRVKILPFFENMKLQKVLRDLIEPPDAVAVDGALERLKGVGALDNSGELTPLGFHLASLPVDVRIGKLLLFGSIFRCLDSALSIAASLSYRSAFVSPFGKREEAMKKKLAFAVRNSDHLAALRAYNGWQEATQRSQSAGYYFAQENFLSQKTLQMLVSMKHQFLELLSSIGFAPESITLRTLSRMSRSANGGDAVVKATGTDFNVNGSNFKLLASILCAALYPNVVQILSPEIKYKQTSVGAMTKAHEAKDLKFKTKLDGYVNIHPSSVNYNVPTYESSYLVFHEKIKTSRVFIRELSMVPVYPMILFGGGEGAEIDMHHDKFVISLENGWMKFVTASQKIAELLKEIRSELDAILEEKIQNPSIDLLVYPKGKLVIETIVNLISIE